MTSKHRNNDIESSSLSSTSVEKRRKTTSTVNNVNHLESNKSTPRRYNKNEGYGNRNSIENSASNSINGRSSAPIYPSKQYLLSSMDLYAQGAIIQVKVKNFVTYSNALFNMGPYLNMIIGPNGTGKSTIVCAIHLGLGGRTEVIGRAKREADFVKKGTSMATIEIRLKDGNSSISIKRTISFENHSEWAINGSKKKFKEVKSVINTFNIQTDNLCQFLPQDRVADFAQMSPMELLNETERAAGSPDLASRHKRLIELNEGLNAKESSFLVKKNFLDQLEQEHQRLKHQVEEIREREKLEESKSIWNNVLNFANYYEAKGRITKYKTFIEKNKDSVSSSQSAAETLAKHLNKWNNEVVQVAKNKEIALKNSIEKSATQTEKMQKHLQTLSGEIAQTNATIKQKEREKIDRKKNLEKLKASIENLEKRTATKPSNSEIERLEVELRSFQERISNYEDSKDESLHEFNQLKNEKIDISKRINELNIKIKRFSDAKARRLHQLANFDEATHKAVVWVQDNMDKFENEVFMPPFLEVNLSDLEMADVVENAMNRNAMLTFTLQSRSDYELFQELVLDQLHLNVHISEFSRSDVPTFDLIRFPCDRRTLNQYGFDGWVIDYVDAPDMVKTMLFHQTGACRVAVSKRGLSRSQIDRAQNLQNKNGQAVFASFVSGREMWTAVRSSYGKRNTVSSMKPLREGGIFKHNNSVNFESEEYQDMKNEMEDLENTQTSIRDKYDIMAEKLNEIDSNIKESKNSAEAIIERKNEIVKEMRQWKREKEMLKNRKETLERESSYNTDDYSKVIDELKEKRTELNNELVNLIVEMTSITEKNFKAQKEIVKARLHRIHVENSSAGIKKMHDELVERVKTVERKLREIRTLMQPLKEEISNLRIIANRGLKELSERNREQVSELFTVDGRNISVEEARMKVESINNRLSLRNRSDDNKILYDYETRSKKIEELHREIEEYEKHVNGIREEIMGIRVPWEKELKGIVSEISKRFSESLARIGCSGEVQLIEDESSYKKWKIVILVKFRDSEELQALTGGRQSGGERSVSTIFYLMAMQEMANSPFRAVDEINQGMDPRNERVVHRRMVEITSLTNSQYFLITPKLLPDLYYNDRMVIHVVYSGKGFFASKSTERTGVQKLEKFGNLSQYVDIGKRLKGISAV